MGSDPGYRVSHMSVAWQKRGIASDNLITVQTRTSHSTHAFGGRLGCYTFEACIFGAKRVRWNEEEVDVLAMIVVEVVVHIRFGEVLDESNAFGATVVEVVVHVS